MGRGEWGVAGRGHDRWIGLEGSLKAHGDWTEAQHRLALDLLGVPKEDRDGPTPLDLGPDEPIAAPAELGPWAPSVLVNIARPSTPLENEMQSRSQQLQSSSIRGDPAAAPFAACAACTWELQINPFLPGLRRIWQAGVGLREPAGDSP